MDCEKFEPLLLDELYEELDEVTSAAVKRHVSGCARCASILNGMRSTRRVAALPMLELPAGLEDRIISSVKEAQKVVPIQSRASRALSWAGSWAMRPQTAMAAVFLLMIGTSAFVIRSSPSTGAGPGASGERSAAVSVTEKGEPAGQAASANDYDSLDNKAAAAAHGANVPTTLPPAVAPNASALTLGDPSSDRAGLVDGLTAGKGRAKSDEARAFGSSLSDDLTGNAGTKEGKDKEEQASNRGNAERKSIAQRGAPVPSPSPTSASRGGDMGNAAAPAGAPYQDYAPAAQAGGPPPVAKTQVQEPQDGFSAGMAAYRSRNFNEAERQFDVAARSGDQNAALWAAKSVKDTPAGCGAAIARFDAVATKSSGTWIGNEATLEAARCQIATGALEPAREKLNSLAKVSSHSAAAQHALNELNQVASRREAAKRAGSGGGGTTRAPAAPAPVRAPAKPADAVDSNKANGY